MVATSKSPRDILLVGYLIGKLALPDYAHRFSPKTYTQPQLFACLVLKEFLHRDYRGIEGLLKDTPELAAVIELKRVPDFTTLQKAAARLLQSGAASRLLDMTVRLGKFVGKLDTKAPVAAMDGTGLESRHASAYYVRRKAKGGKSEQKLTYQRFPKAGLVSDCKSHLILAVVPQRGPGPDIMHFRKAFDQARRRLQFKTLAADAGYDAEHTHVYGRSRGVRTLIPPLIGRPTTKPPAGYWRRTMLRVLPRSRYGQRWQAETVNSMLKRLLGSALRARNYWSQCRETVLRALTLNVMILRRRKVFDRAFLTPLSPLCPLPLSPLGGLWYLTEGDVEGAVVGTATDFIPSFWIIDIELYLAIGPDRYEEIKKMSFQERQELYVTLLKEMEEAQRNSPQLPAGAIPLRGGGYVWIGQTIHYPDAPTEPTTVVAIEEIEKGKARIHTIDARGRECSAILESIIIIPTTEKPDEP